MKIISILLSLLFIFPTFAAGFNQLLEEFIADSEQNYGAPVGGESCDGENIKSLEERCAVALCGPANKQPDTIINDSNYDKYVTQDAVKKFEAIIPEIVKAGNQKIKDAKMLASELKQKLKGGKKVDLNQLQPYQFDEIAEKIFQDNYSLIIDSSKPLGQRFEIKANYPVGATESFKKSLDHYLASFEVNFRNDPFESLIRGLYTVDEAAAIAKDKLQKFLEKYEAIKKSKPKELSQYKGGIDTMLASIDMNADNDVYDYSFLLSDLTYFNSALTSIETGNLPSNPYPKCGNECKSSLNTLISQQDLIKDLTYFEDMAEHMGDPNFNITSCRADVYSKAIGNYESGVVAKEVPQILERMLKHPLKKFSRESKKSYRSFVLGEIDFESGIVNSYDAKIKELKTVLADSGSSTKGPAESANKSSAELFFEYYSNYKDGIDGFDGVQMELPCDSFGEVGMISDSFLGGSGTSDSNRSKISISMFSDLHLATGKAVTAHEMGHALSFLAGNNKLSKTSSKEYMKTRSCISKLHKYETPNDTTSYHQRTESIYIEEDHADSIAYVAYNDGKLHECSLLSRSENSYTYLAMKSSDVGDSHSESLLRVVREAFYKDVKLPLSCEQLVDQNKDNFRFEKCY